jgi:hypothetical protein
VNFIGKEWSCGVLSSTYTHLTMTFLFVFNGVYSIEIVASDGEMVDEW